MNEKILLDMFLNLEKIQREYEHFCLIQNNFLMEITSLRKDAK